MICKELLDRVPHLSTDNMEYEEWLEKRKESIGGSDAGAIMGYGGKYGSPLTVFAQKKGLEKCCRDMSPSAKRGKLLEPLIRDWFAAAYPAAIIEKVPYMFRPSKDGYEYSRPHGDKLRHFLIPSFMSANIDGLIFTETPIKIGAHECVGLGGLEIKSSRDGFDFSEDEIPDSYYAQVQHYMAVLNLDWFIVSAAILSKEEIVNYIIPRNDDFIFELIEAETKFWNEYILTDTWPPALGIEGEEDMITGMFEGGTTLVLDDEARELCREYIEAQAKYKAAEAEKERISTELKAAIVRQQSGGTGEKKISAIAGRYSVSWSRYMRHSVDTDAMKKAGVYEQYTKEYESGMFRITEKKGA
jgi:predicted phage-related endonuclease